MTVVMPRLDGPVRLTTAGAGARPQAYIHHNAIIRRIFKPLAVRGHRDTILFVRGRKSAKRLAVPMDPPFEWEGSRYLVSPLGNTHWARNLRAAGRGELRTARRWSGSVPSSCTVRSATASSGPTPTRSPAAVATTCSVCPTRRTIRCSGFGPRPTEGGRRSTRAGSRPQPHRTEREDHTITESASGRHARHRAAYPVARPSDG